MAIAVMAVSGCGSNGKFGGTLTGIESDSLMVMAYHVNDRTPAYVDTVALENDRFSITFKDTSLLKCHHPTISDGYTPHSHAPHRSFTWSIIPKTK